MMFAELSEGEMFELRHNNPGYRFTKIAPVVVPGLPGTPRINACAWDDDATDREARESWWSMSDDDEVIAI